MLAEKPSIVIPHVLGQFLWANKIYELNVGMKPIKSKDSKDLNKKILVITIELLKTNHKRHSHLQYWDHLLIDNFKACVLNTIFNLSFCSWVIVFNINRARR